MVIETLRAARASAQRSANSTSRSYAVVGFAGNYIVVDAYTARRDYSWDIVCIVEPETY